MFGGDITKLTYPCLMYCLCHELENDFKTRWEITHIPGWSILHDQVIRVELAMMRLDNIKKEFPNKEEFIIDLQQAMSLAKELLGSHTHINFLWRLQQMVKNWHLQKTITFDEITKIEETNNKTCDNCGHSVSVCNAAKYHDGYECEGKTYWEPKRE